MNSDLDRLKKSFERRNFLKTTSLGLGAIALKGLMGGSGLLGQNEMHLNGIEGGLPGLPHFAPKAKRVIYLFMSGGPSQIDLFDHKPKLRQLHGTDLPDSVRKGQRLTGMSAGQSALPLSASSFDFEKHGQSEQWVSSLLPHTAKVVDELCMIKSMYTEQINHDPAITFFQTGHQLAGRPSIGSWLNYGLGSSNKNLPSFIVMVSKNGGGQPLYARLWGNGFLPSHHQGVQFRSGKDPVLFLNNPEGYSGMDRRQMINKLGELNKFQADAYNDPEILNKLKQYEMAFRMQTSVPEVMDTKGEKDYIYDLYGQDSRDSGTFAANCLLARKLIEKDVKFVQLYHQGWDQHSHLFGGIQNQCKRTDQATAGLIQDLKQRGLLEDTLVIWGGEFGRTVYSQGKLTKETTGRDHHPRCFTMWMAGAGVKKGFSYGETDDFSYNIKKDPVHVHDFHATMLHLLGIDHEKLTFKHQGRRYRLTDVHGEVKKELLA